jgi:acyl dehydratase
MDTTDMTMTFFDGLTAQIGQTWHSDWLTVDQSMIDAFADATGDHQFIHVDPARATTTPFGSTVAHGFLTLSLLSRLNASSGRPPIPGVKMGVNYGLEHVRFVASVRSGSRVRGAFTLAAIEEKRPGQFQQTLNCTIEIKGSDKPALVAIWLTQFFA